MVAQKPDRCLECRRPFQRRHPTQKFCAKNSAGRHVCKDNYHNRNKSERREDEHEAIMAQAFPFGSEADIGGWR